MLTTGVVEMEHQFNKVNEESLKISLKKQYRKKQISTQQTTIVRTEIETVSNCKCLGQTIAMENRTRQEVSIRIKAGRSFLLCLKYREIFLDRHLAMSLERKVFNQCVLPTMTYGCQTWSLTKALVKKYETSQQAKVRKMLNVTPKDRICNNIIRQRARVTDIVQYVTSAK